MCTGVRFNDAAGNMYLGRNLDWCVGYGQGIVITPRGKSVPSPFQGTIKPKYAVIGMAITVGDVPLYFDVYNEAGLGIAGLNFPGYCGYAPDAIEGTTNIAAYEFPFWVAANFSTVAEAKAAIENVTIVAKPINEKFPVSELHWIIGDNKESIVVEYTPEGMQIFDNDLDVLTNQPGYGWHHENVRNYLHIENDYPGKIVWTRDSLVPFSSGSTMLGIPGAFDPVSRFVRVAFFNAHYPAQTGEKDNVTRLFHTLQAVAMCKGASMMSNNEFEFTVYTGGFSSATKTYYFQTYDDFGLTSASLNDYDLDATDFFKVA